MCFPNFPKDTYFICKHASKSLKKRRYLIRSNEIKWGCDGITMAGGTEEIRGVKVSSVLHAFFHLLRLLEKKRTERKPYPPHNKCIIQNMYVTLVLTRKLFQMADRAFWYDITVDTVRWPHVNVGSLMIPTKICIF